MQDKFLDEMGRIREASMAQQAAAMSLGLGSVRSTMQQYDREGNYDAPVKNIEGTERVRQPNSQYALVTHREDNPCSMEKTGRIRASEESLGKGAGDA